MTNQETHTRLVDMYRRFTEPLAENYRDIMGKDLTAIESAIGMALAAEVRDTEERMLPRKGGV